MRQLKFHEKKLLKKVNFLTWKTEHNHREAEVMRRYHLGDRDDYKKYNQLYGQVTKLVSLLRQLDARDPARISLTDALLEKLYNMGAIPSTKSLALCDKLSTSSFCRRRLSVIMVRLKMVGLLGLSTSTCFPSYPGLQPAFRPRIDAPPSRVSTVTLRVSVAVTFWVNFAFPACPRPAILLITLFFCHVLRLWGLQFSSWRLGSRWHQRRVEGLGC